MAERKRVDWDSVEPLYIAGVLSNLQICEQYAADHQHSQTYKTNLTEGAIRKQAKTKGWQKNIAGKVQQKIKEKVVRGQVRTSYLSDKDVIDEAAEVGVKIVFRHQKEVLALIDHEERLLTELRETTEDINLKTKTEILKNLAAVRNQRIALERVVNNIGDASDGQSFEDAIKAI